MEQSDIVKRQIQIKINSNDKLDRVRSELAIVKLKLDNYLVEEDN